MVNVYIYLDSEKTAQEIAVALMENDLAAHASIDRDNNSYVKVSGNVLKESIYVLTLQTKALLFDKIVKTFFISSLSGLFGFIILKYNKLSL
jgi:uncharacterized protein involved in tolerance to divalent cations